MLRRSQLSKENANSRSSSRAGSVAQTPLRLDDSDYEDDGDDDLMKLTELLNSKLQSIQVAQESENKEDRPAGDIKQFNVTAFNKARIQSEATSINDIISSLGMPRTQVSSLSRELLLMQLYRLVVSKSLVVQNGESMGTSQFVDEEKVGKLVLMLTLGNYRSETEFLFLLKSVVALISSNIEDSGEFLTATFFQTLESLVLSAPSSIVTNDNKANVIKGIVCLSLVMFHGASSFGIDDRILWLFEVAEGYFASAIVLRKNLESGEREHSTVISDRHEDTRLMAEAAEIVEQEVQVCTSALHGVACLLTLLTTGNYLNEFMEDLVLKLMPFVDNDEIRDVAKAAGRVVALIYELYQYDLQDDEGTDDNEYNTNAPYYEQGTMISIFERLINLSSKRVSKKDKKDFRSIFRNILHTVEAYTVKEKRIAMINGTEEGLEYKHAFMDSTHIKLSKYKSLPVCSWYLYSRLRILRWCFSFGLHNQLIANQSIRDCLVEPEGQIMSSSQYHGLDLNDDVLGEDDTVIHNALKEKFQQGEKYRSDRVKRERALKWEELIKGLDIRD